MKLIVGLGNPDKKYNKTRHNVGFMIVDAFLGDIKYQEKFNSWYTKTIIEGETVYFVKPKTYMNNSGFAVRDFVKFFNIDIKDILIIQDDLDENFGQYKLKKNSSSGGHNGIKSIIQELGTDEFARLKIGIKNEYINDTIDFVLDDFSKKEQEELSKMTKIYNEIIESFIRDGIEKTMNIYNSKWGLHEIFKWIF